MKISKGSWHYRLLLNAARAEITENRRYIGQHIETIKALDLRLDAAAKAWDTVKRYLGQAAMLDAQQRGMLWDACGDMNNALVVESLVTNTNSVVSAETTKEHTQVKHEHEWIEVTTIKNAAEDIHKYECRCGDMRVTGVVRLSPEAVAIIPPETE